MPNSSTNLHVDQLLSNISIKVAPQGFIAKEVFPVVNVLKDGDKYRIYGRDFKIPNLRRANRAESKELDLSVSYSSYYLKHWSAKVFISDTDVENNDVGDLRADATEFLSEKLQLQLEKAAADLMTKTTFTLYQSLSTGGVWSSNTTTTDPIPSTDTACASVLMNSGYRANIAACPRSVYNLLKNHVSILDRIKYTSSEVSENILAKILGVDKLLVADAAYDSTVDFEATTDLTESISEIWPDCLFFAYRPASPGLLKPSAGYTFMKNKPMIKRWREEAREGEWIEGNLHASVNAVCTLAGYLVLNCV